MGLVPAALQRPEHAAQRRWRTTTPAREYVDVLSLDGYNWGSKHPEYGGWQSFEQIFGDAYKRLTKLGPQPIWIAEVGSAPAGRRQGRLGARHVGDRPHDGRA